MLGSEKFRQIQLRVQAGTVTPDDLRRLLVETERLRNILSDIADVAVDYDGAVTVEGLRETIDGIAWMARGGVVGEAVYWSEGAGRGEFPDD